ncbi:dTDP-4-dehydrorhamnose reductase [Ensifer adhaerens]|uniref:dTDP-4-dehydrorhamnose reductase n=1 Tax=Ensifer adhaerens TaxID=106592 RepID=UPI00399B87C7
MSPPLRFLVTGLTGQVVQALLETGRDQPEIAIIALGRPQLDLMNTKSIVGVLKECSPDIVVSAAAYTSVDLAESNRVAAFKVNSEAPRELAIAASDMRVPIIHLSTDYVFDGTKNTPYVETDTAVPLGVYGQSKLQGEKLISAVMDDHVILRTAWVYSPFGRSFMRTILDHARTRKELLVVDDQVGNPTSALDLAREILSVGKNLLNSRDRELRGTFHLTATGDASWADFAEEILKASRAIDGPSAEVRRISAADYPTPARRPSNSRLCSRKIQDHHGIRLPVWSASVSASVCRLLQHV